MFKIFVVFCVLTVFSCKKKEGSVADTTNETTTSGNTASATTSTALTSASSEFIKFSLITPPAYSSVSYSISQPSNGAWNISSGGLTVLPSLPNYYKQTQNYLNTSGQTTFIISKKDSTTETTSPISDAFFRNFCKVQNYYKYATSSVSSDMINSCGIDVSVKDASNVWWYSINPLGSNKTYQTITTSFAITENIEYLNSQNQLKIKNKITFSCKLYNNSGDSLYLSGGSMIISFTK